MFTFLESTPELIVSIKKNKYNLEFLWENIEKQCPSYFDLIET